MTPQLLHGLNGLFQIGKREKTRQDLILHQGSVRITLNYFFQDDEEKN